MENNAQSFEEKLKAANEILAQLNKSDISLEQSIKLHKDGKILLFEASKILENAKLSIKEIDDGLDDEKEPSDDE